MYWFVNEAPELMLQIEQIKHCSTTGHVYYAQPRKCFLTAINIYLVLLYISWSFFTFLLQ